MEKREKLIRVICCHDACKKPFHLRMEVQQAEAEGTAEVGVDCPLGELKMIGLKALFLRVMHLSNPGNGQPRQCIMRKLVMMFNARFVPTIATLNQGTEVSAGQR